MPQNILTVKTLDVPRLLQRADRETVQRGQSYYQQRRVNLRRVGEDGAHAQVRGSTSRPHDVLAEMADGRVHLRCDCPVAGGDAGVICKHAVAVALTLRDYLHAHPPQTWEDILGRALAAPPPRAEPVPKLMLLLSLQQRYSSWGVHAYSLPAASVPDPQADAHDLLKDIKRGRLGPQAKPVRSKTDPRHYVNITSANRGALQLLAMTHDAGYDPYGSTAAAVKNFLPPLRGASIFQGSEDGPFQHVLEVAALPAVPVLEVSEVGRGLRLQAILRTGGRSITLDDPGLVRLCADPLWLLYEGVALPVEEIGPAFDPFLRTPDLVIPDDERETFVGRFLLPLAARLPIIGPAVTWEDEGSPPQPRLYLSERDGTLGAALRFGYGSYELPYEKTTAETLLLGPSEGLTLVRVARRADQEEALRQSVTEYGFKRGTEPGLFALRANVAPVDFLLRQVPRLAAAGFTVYGEEALTSARVNRNPPQLSWRVSSGIDWFDLDAVVSYGDQELALKDVRRAVRRHERYVKLADGTIGEIPDEWLERYRTLFAFADETESGLRLDSSQIGLLDQLMTDGEPVEADSEFERRRERLRAFEKITPQPLPSGLRATLRPYQKAGVDWLHFLHDYEFGGCLADDMGLGKAQPLDAKVLTPTGWRRMGDICVGDRVINSQGSASAVIGVFPQGEKQIFRVTFSDGSHTECCDDHLWSVNTAVRNRRGNVHQVLPLSAIRERLRDRAGNCRHFIPVVKPVEFSEAKLPLHPYLLGALLGDGGLGRLDRVMFSTADAEMLDRIREVLPPTAHLRYCSKYDWRLVGDGTRGGNPTLNALRDLGLAGHLTADKFIPDIYKFSSVGSRICLLQGLLDTDGHAGVGKNIEFLSVSPRLAADVLFLVQSLGGVATMREKRTARQLAYRLNITLPSGVAPFALSRKAAASPPRTKYHPARAFVSVDYVGVKPAQCIAVASADHLYVTDDCIVTHNTVTTLTFLQSLHERGASTAATLLVLPRSLVSNWEREAARFTPGLRVLSHAHPTRARDIAGFDGHDLVLTTYGVLLRDIELLRQHRFHYVILDEAQAIKNPLSQSGRAARLLQADHRLTLTGTPVENSTLELWSQFAFVNPGLLGTLDQFRSEFTGPIEKGQDEAAANSLRALVRPFLLRRTKDQVARDLPPRTERIVVTEMEPAQRKMYDLKRDEYRAQLLGLMDDRGMDNVRMKILEGLLRLRQISNHPRLVEPQSKAGSAKMDTLLETLETLRAEGHKALVFSQFVGMLTLLRAEMDARGIPYAYLDGKTKDRQERVDRFQGDPELPFFLISLRAGGVGLNLTAADYVLHVDPWWNPAVEMQATDRTHRIGQDKPVFVYKFIARDSVEEKILELQERKRSLVSRLVGTEAGLFKSLTRKDIEALFR